MADGAVMDVSFISIIKIIPALEKLIKPGGYLMALIKPQFETEREKVGKHGVVRDQAIHVEVLERVTGFIQENTSFSLVDLDYSPIRGPEGNIEFLMYCRLHCDGLSRPDVLEKIQIVVENAHHSL
jgi:23S rRNA (cytidine1920-2'-O)/16S rRNA (cytidine1409-2'-O)-methyltransferase